MRKMRKGFTLIELLVVIAVMGILGTMAMISGQEATSAARANNIADNLEKAAVAMMMYYSENCESIDVSGVLPVAEAAAKIATGANAYLKTELKSGATEDNTYFVAINGSGATTTWWVGYKFPDTASAGDTQVMKILVNKAGRMGLKKVAAGDDYDGTATVVMQVR